MHSTFSCIPRKGYLVLLWSNSGFALIGRHAVAEWQFSQGRFSVGPWGLAVVALLFCWERGAALGGGAPSRVAVSTTGRASNAHKTSWSTVSVSSPFSGGHLIPPLGKGPLKFPALCADSRGETTVQTGSSGPVAFLYLSLYLRAVRKRALSIFRRDTVGYTRLGPP